MGWLHESAHRPDREPRPLRTSYLAGLVPEIRAQAVDGVSEVATIGPMVKQYQIVVGPKKLRAHAITLAPVLGAIQSANQETGGCVIEMDAAMHRRLDEDRLLAEAIGRSLRTAPWRWASRSTAFYR
jgi:Cu/Ag efflux pump CusA